jgi:hypothetical protein
MIDLQNTRLLAEVLRLQRWAGGDAVPADRVFGLMNGFESVINEENESPGVTEEQQEEVENMLEEIESGEQPADGMAIKERLHRDGIDELKAILVMKMCMLQSRFPDALKKLASSGSGFEHVSRFRTPEANWFGALHHLELIDTTDGAYREMHAVFSPCIPRAGEIIEPERGSRMRVANVTYVIGSQGESPGITQPILIPHVHLEALGNDEDNESGDTPSGEDK